MNITAEYEKAEDYEIEKCNYTLSHNKYSIYDTVGFHYHGFFEIYFFIDGDIEYFVEDKSYKLEKGDIIITPPYVYHRAISSKNMYYYDRYILKISANYIDGIFGKNSMFYINDKKSNLIRTSAEEQEKLKMIFDDLDMVEKDSRFAEIECRAYVSLLFSIMAKSIKQYNRLNSTLIQDVIEYINNHITEDISLDKISESFHFNKFYLLREFKKYTNVTIYNYITNKRIILAKNLMANGVAIGEAASKSGFNSYANFYKAFVKVTGCKPSDFNK